MKNKGKMIIPFVNDLNITPFSIFYQICLHNPDSASLCTFIVFPNVRFHFRVKSENK